MKQADVPQVLINGLDRGEENCWVGELGKPLNITFAKKGHIREIRILLDSDIDRKTIGDVYLPDRPTVSNYIQDQPTIHVPQTLIKDLVVETAEGKLLHRVEDNHQRLLILPVDEVCTGIRILPTATQGVAEARIFSIQIKEK